MMHWIITESSAKGVQSKQSTQWTNQNLTQNQAREKRATAKNRSQARVKMQPAPKRGKTSVSEVTFGFGCFWLVEETACLL